MTERLLIARPTRIMDRIEGILAESDAALAAAAPATARELLDLGEKILERWIEAHGGTPTQQSLEGFRLLALHRQGAAGRRNKETDFLIMQRWR